MKDAGRLRAGFRHLQQAACNLQHPAYRRKHAASSLHAGFITIVCNLHTIVSRLHTLVCRLHTVVLSKCRVATVVFSASTPCTSFIRPILNFLFSTLLGLIKIFLLAFRPALKLTIPKNFIEHLKKNKFLYVTLVVDHENPIKIGREMAETRTKARKSH